MRKSKYLGVMIMMLSAALVFAQAKQLKTLRRPEANAAASTEGAQAEAQGGEHSYRILNGLPTLLRLHHDTEVGTNNPVDVYVLVLEMQVMNSDGDREPIGLQIFNFYTKYPQDPKDEANPNSAEDCKKWYGLQIEAMKNRNSKINTWPYMELVTRPHARVIQTNEDGAVWWSDDIECWGSTDRFPPF